MSRPLIHRLLLGALVLPWLCGLGCKVSEDPSELVPRLVPRGLSVEVSSFDLFNATELGDNQWSLHRPPLSAAMLSSTTGSATTFVPDVSGVYQVYSHRTEGAASMVGSEIIVANNDAPKIELMLEGEVFVGEMATAQSVIYDLNNDSIDLNWSLTGPPGSSVMISPQGGLRATFVPDVLGEYVVSVQADDGEAVSPIATSAISAGVYVPPINAQALPFMHSMTYSATHDVISYVEYNSSLTPSQYKLIFMDLGTGFSEGIELLGRPRGLELDPTGDTLIMQVEPDMSVANEFLLFDIAGKVLVDTYTVDSSFFDPYIYVNAGGGLVRAAYQGSLFRVDVINETRYRAFAPQPIGSDKPAYIPTLDALYQVDSAIGPDNDANLIHIDMQAPVPNILRTRTVTLADDCIEAAYAISNNTEVLTSDGQIFSATAIEGTDMQQTGSMATGCFQWADELASTGQLAVIPYEYAPTSFSVFDIASRSLQGSYAPTVLLDQVVLDGPLIWVFLAANGVDYYAVYRVDFNLYALAKGRL